MPDYVVRNNGSNRLVDLLKLGAEYLAQKGLEDSRLEAERFLGDVLKMDRVGLYLHFDRPLSESEKNLFREMLKRRATGEPLQYIIGNCEFYGYEFSVEPGVLIPRPDTEPLIDLAKELKPENGFVNAMDIGCGSGAIALTLLEEKIAEKVLAVDISETAVQVSAKNALNLGFKALSPALSFEKKDSSAINSLQILHSDAFSEEFNPTNQPFDLIVSNPPYITECEYNKLPVHIKNHEPEIALKSGKDGLDAHRIIAAKLKTFLKAGGVFLGEIGFDQAESITKLYKNFFKKVEIHPDLNQLPRIVKCIND